MKSSISRTLRPWRFGCLLLSLLLLSLLWPVSAGAQPLADQDTLLLVQFDRSCDAEFARGTITGHSKAPLVAGRFGRGIDLRTGYGVSFIGDDGNFHPAAGTIEFWIMPHWHGSDPNNHTIFSCRFGQRGYININTLGNGRLGIAISAGEGKAWKWRRADADVSAWKAGQWHHVACTWGDGQVGIYADGRVGELVADARMPGEAPKTMVFAASDAVLDGVRISKSAFTAERVRQSIKQSLGPAPYRFLDDLVARDNPRAIVGFRTRLGDVRIPLVLGHRHYAKSVALASGKQYSVRLDGNDKVFQAEVGVDFFSPKSARCSLEVWDDDKILFQSEPLSVEHKSVTVKIPVVGVQELTFRCRPVDPGDSSLLGVWANAFFVRSDTTPPLMPGQVLKNDRLAMYQRQNDADRYAFRPPSRSPYWLVPKHWEDELDPKQVPAADEINKPLAAFAAPGEYEPVNFVIYANDDLKQVRVRVDDLRGDTGTISSARIDVRLVLRGLMRDLYAKPVERSTVVSRFLWSNRPVDIAAGTLREYHLIVHVPKEAAPGVYRGQVHVAPSSHAAISLPLRFDVLPIRLRPLKDRAYGVYYRFPRGEGDWSRVDQELEDIHEHGGTTLVPSLHVTFVRDDDRIRSSTEQVQHGLDLMRKHGFHGAVPIDTGLPRLARLLEYDPAKETQNATVVQQFQTVGAQSLQSLVKLNERYPDFELLATHMDEVFGRDRLLAYIRSTQLVRSTTSLRVYITLHNSPRPEIETFMRRCDPYVDVRSYNGHAMDDWIRAGHTFQQLREELDRSGDEAWIYYNIRGSFFKANWTRLVNGFYLWVSPLRVHVPWMYYSYSGNPLDDTDGPSLRGHDFVYAVPDPADPTRMISTRHWEAFREGIDDMRYLRTLEALIAEKKGTPEAAAAAKWLRQLRQTLAFSHKQLQAIESESPILILWSTRFNGAALRRFRREAARHIHQLQNGVR